MSRTTKRHPLPSLADAEPAGYLANPSGGYVWVPRGLMDPGHPLAPARTGEPASRREALVDLLGMAAWRDGPDRAHGEVLAGTRWLSDRWRWPRTRVRRFLEELEAVGTVSWMRGTRQGEPSRIIVVGYAKLQRGPKSGPPTLPPSGPTRSAHLSPNDGAGSPAAVAHPPGPPSWPAGETPTKSEETASHQEHDEGRGQPPPKKKASEEELERLLFPDLEEAATREAPREPAKPSEKNPAAYWCSSCRAPVGPTAELCAPCKYAPTPEASP